MLPTCCIFCLVSYLAVLLEAFEVDRSRYLCVRIGKRVDTIFVQQCEENDRKIVDEKEDPVAISTEDIPRVAEALELLEDFSAQAHTLDLSGAFVLAIHYFPPQRPVHALSGPNALSTKPPFSTSPECTPLMSSVVAWPLRKEYTKESLCKQKHIIYMYR